MSDTLNILLWVVYPYVSITIFLIGHIFTYIFRKYHWTARSTELLQKKYHIIISNFFHYGIILVLIGHILGLLLFPRLGIPPELHYSIAFTLGSVSGIIALIGILGLIIRAYLVPEVRATLRFTDHLVYVLLLLIIISGAYVTFVVHPDYRKTVAPWILGIITFSPDLSLITEEHPILKFHIILTFLLFILWPFSRLVHVWTLPITYLWRPYIIYRGFITKIFSRGRWR
jgi:nitrate reductase gamma subunit